MAKADPLIDLRLSSTFTHFSQDGSGVVAHFTNAAGEAERVAGAYLVSCEGARSIVRKDLDIEFEGFTYSDLTLNIEVAYDFRRHGYAERNYISDPTEWSNLFHWRGPPDRWRVHFPVDASTDQDGVTREDALQARLQAFLPTGRAFEIVGSNLYTVHQRVAKKFRAGRAILAGDAAHVNSPIGAMGMNSGIHDAVSLASNLIRVLHGDESDAALDRYVRQRRHVATAHVQTATIANKQTMEQRDPIKRQRYRDDMRRRAEDPALAKAFLMRTALIDSLRDAAKIP
jgi:3-(3-hydroxy-phenyl)propionate hydroxylase